MHTLVWSAERQAQAKSHCDADCLITETKGGHWESPEPCSGLPTLDSQETSFDLAVSGQIKKGPVGGLHPWHGVSQAYCWCEVGGSGGGCSWPSLQNFMAVLIHIVDPKGSGAWEGESPGPIQRSQQQRPKREMVQDELCF